MKKRTRILAPLAAVGLTFALGACSDDESVFNAEVGECVENLSDLSGSIEELPETACTEDHEGEIFFLVEHEGDDDDFPGQSELQAEAAEACEGDEFEDYMGVEFSETLISVAYVTPSAQSWGEGDRETICVASTGEVVDESFEGNGDEFPLVAGGGDTGGGDTGGGDTGGGEQDFSALIDECEGGDNAACDELWLNTPVGSEEERIGATCGGRSDEELDGGCAATLGE